MEFTQSWKWLKLGTFITHKKQLFLVNDWTSFELLKQSVPFIWDLSTSSFSRLAGDNSHTLQFRGHVSKQTTQPLIPNAGPSTNVRSKGLRWTLTAGLTSAVCKRGMRKAHAVILSYAFSDQPNPTGCLSVSDEPNPISAPSS